MNTATLKVIKCSDGSDGYGGSESFPTWGWQIQIGEDLRSVGGGWLSRERAEGEARAAARTLGLLLRGPIMVGA